MLAVLLKSIFRFTMTLSVVLGLIIMIICTALVIACAISGDIEISIVRCENEKEKK